MQITGRHVDRPVKGNFIGKLGPDGLIEIGDTGAMDFWLRVQLEPAEIMAIRQTAAPGLLAQLGNIEGLPQSLREWSDKAEEALQQFKERKSAPKPALVVDSVAGCEVPAYQLTLDQDWSDCERGGILLVNSESERFNAWLHQCDDIWLEITWVPDNYPSLNVTLVKISDEDLWRHLVKTFDTTTMIRKLNLGDHTSSELEEAWVTKDEQEDG